jgi:predicted transcriptional regulator
MAQYKAAAETGSLIHKEGKVITQDEVEKRLDKWLIK